MHLSLKFFVQEVRPTLFMGVPRVWEKIKDAVELQLTQMSGFKKWAFDRASVSVIVAHIMYPVLFMHIQFHIVAYKFGNEYFVDFKLELLL